MSQQSQATDPPKFFLGTQGFAYKDWVGVFYPDGTPPSGYLELYSRVYDTVELDTTFYGPPRPETIRQWRDAVPGGFVFTAKMPKIITHDKRLAGAEPELVEFLSAMLEFGPKLGPILIQLPPSFSAAEMATLAKFTEILPDEFRYAVELRHRSWQRPETAALLEQRNLAWTIIDLHGMPKDVNLTTDFTYIRWLGNRSDVKRLNKVTVDRSADIEWWAKQIDRIAERVHRIYGYMNNHYAGHSPASLNELRRRLGMETAPAPIQQVTQETLFS